MESRKPSSFVWTFPVLLAAVLGLLAWGIILARHGDRSILAAGIVCFVLVALGWAWTMIHLAGRDAIHAHLDAMLTPVNERMQHLSVLVNQVSEQQLISERAKAIAFRESERDALRRAIREEIARKDWDAAIMLANEIEAVFGYKQEADRLRAEIAAYREADVRRSVDEAMAIIDRHCRAEQWTEAAREADRIAALFPGDVQAHHLRQDVETRRLNFKKDLLQRWHDAVGQHDIDNSIDILKQLDAYLTPAEAAEIQDTARQVFKDKRLLLGQHFAEAVREHRWAEAIRLGESIASEFPNTRMAQEVRDKMDLLRQRAAEPPQSPAPTTA